MKVKTNLILVILIILFGLNLSMNLRAGSTEHKSVKKNRQNINTLIFKGNGTEYFSSSALDNKGNLILIGDTSSTDLKTTLGFLYKGEKAKEGIMIVKIKPDMKTIIASTIIKAEGKNSAISVDVDKKGNIFIFGHTTSSTFPMAKKGFDLSYNGGPKDYYILKINNSLTKIISSTFIGGSGFDGPGNGASIKINSKGDVIVSGRTTSEDFPVTKDSFCNKFKGQMDVFVTKLNNELTELKSSTFIGGKDREGFLNMVINKNDDVYITGYTGSSDFPVSSDAYDQKIDKGDFNIFISKFDKDLKKLMASTFIGKDGSDFSYGITLDSKSNVFITGHAGNNFPTTKNAFNRIPKSQPDQVYIAKLDKNLMKLLASTFIGGSAKGMYGKKYSRSIICDKKNNVYILGLTSISDYPVTANVIGESYNGGRDSFLTKLDNKLTKIIASTYIGGKGTDSLSCLLSNAKDELFIAGYTSSIDFPGMTLKTNQSPKKDVDAVILKINNSLTKSENSIHALAKQGKIKEIIKILKKDKTLINSIDRDGKTVLSAAAGFGKSETVQFLLSNKAKLNITDKNGYSTLHSAASNGDYKTINILLKSGALKNTIDLMGDTPLHIASKFGKIDVVKLLLKNISDINIQNKNGNTPLHLAGSFYYKDIVSLLISSGADISVKNKEGKTPLFLSCESMGNSKVINLFIKKGANINIRDNNGFSPLLKAISTRARDNAKLLILNGADVNAKNNEDKTPLYYAVAIGHGYEEVIKLLLKKGADKNTKDKKGISPYELVLKKGQKEIINLFKKK